GGAVAELVGHDGGKEVEGVSGSGQHVGGESRAIIRRRSRCRHRGRGGFARRGRLNPAQGIVRCLTRATKRQTVLERTEARARSAISRSPPYARSFGASARGSHRTSATPWPVSGGRSPRRPLE